MDNDNQNSKGKSAPALILVYLVPLALGYGYFLNEALRMGGAEGNKILILIGVSALLGTVYFAFRSFTAQKANRDILDSTTTLTTVAICIVSMLILYACKDFMPKAFLEKEPVIDQR